MNLNKAILIGRVTKDPLLRETGTGTRVVTFGLATNHTYKNKDGEKVEEVDFHNIVVFGKNAELISQYVTKGQLLYVEGRIKNSNYEKEGVKHYKTDIMLDKFQFGPKPDSMGRGDQKEEISPTKPKPIIEEPAPEVADIPV